MTANDITEITINIIFNLIKNSISKALKLQMLTCARGEPNEALQMCHTVKLYLHNRK